MKRKVQITIIIGLILLAGMTTISSTKISKKSTTFLNQDNSVNSSPVLSTFRVEYVRPSIGGKLIIEIESRGYDSEEYDLMYFWRITSWGNQYLSDGDWVPSGQLSSMLHRLEEKGELEFEGHCINKEGKKSNQLYDVFDTTKSKSFSNIQLLLSQMQNFKLIQNLFDFL